MKTPCNALCITGSFHSCCYMFYSSLSKLSETSKFLLVIITFCVCFHKISLFKKEGYWGVVPQIKMYHSLYVASGK